MSKNRKHSKKMAVMTSRVFGVGAVLLSVFAMIILNLLASSSGEQLMKSIGERNLALDRLNEECERASSRWEKMKSPDKLEAALLSHGLSMRYPKPEQIIMMDGQGRVIPRQLSAARAASRATGVRSAQYRRPTGRSGRVRR